ncbi:MAG: p-hydroxybenzoic acid efflux pump subunit AaeA [Chlamydiae bacterium]|nr:p-hydroxybenzoic acid efflux pump subunit AaeA [Chlamydiota bacterium]
MFKKYGIPILASLGVLLALIMVIIGLQKPPVPPIDHPPAKSPFLHYVAGSGIIEASSLNINVSTAIAGPIEAIFVQPGDIVEKGTPLFRVDTRELVANEKEAAAAQTVTVANFNRLINQPRAEEIPPLEAQVKQAQLRLSDEFAQYTLFQNVSDKRAISFNDFNQQKYAAGIAKAEFAQSKADLELLKAGAWIEDIKISNQEVEEATAKLNVSSTQLERATTKAPLDGMVMQINVNVGDFARGSREDTIFQDSLMVFGSIDPMHVRIDIDEDDAWRVFPGAPAVAFVRGNSEICFSLEFVRIEPYVVPKRTLTGENLERVDTRVLQLIYRFQRKDLPIYLGQLLDIFIEAKPSQGL